MRRLTSSTALSRCLAITADFFSSSSAFSAKLHIHSKTLIQSLQENTGFLEQSLQEPTAPF